MLRSTHWIIDHSKMEMEHPGFKNVALVGGTNHGFCESQIHRQFSRWFTAMANRDLGHHPEIFLANLSRAKSFSSFFLLVKWWNSSFISPAWNFWSFLDAFCWFLKKPSFMRPHPLRSLQPRSHRDWWIFRGSDQLVMSSHSAKIWKWYPLRHDQKPSGQHSSWADIRDDHSPLMGQ